VEGQLHRHPVRRLYFSTSTGWAQHGQGFLWKCQYLECWLKPCPFIELYPIARKAMIDKLSEFTMEVFKCTILAVHVLNLQDHGWRWTWRAQMYACRQPSSGRSGWRLISNGFNDFCGVFIHTRTPVFILGFHTSSKQLDGQAVVINTVRVVQLWVNSGTTGVTVLDGTLASAYVLRPCCRSCSVFRRCRRQIEKERRQGVILVDIQAKVYSGVFTSLYMEVKAD